MADIGPGAHRPATSDDSIVYLLRPAALVVFATLLAWLTVKAAAHLAGALLPGMPAIMGNAPLLDLIFSVGVFGPIALAGLAGAVAVKGRLGWGDSRRAWLALGLAVGIGGIAINLVYAWIGDGLSRGGAGPVDPLWWIVGSLLVLFQATAEEVYFRGWLQPVLERRWGNAVAVTLSALSFALVHLAGEPKQLLTIVNMALGGVLFGLLALRSRGLLAPIAAHFGWNWAEGLLFGLDPNPGVGAFGAAFDFDLTGSLWWGGNSEGLNMSIGTSLVLLALILPLAVWMPKIKVAMPPVLRPHAPRMSVETRRYLLGDE
jgi:membrane protease YdiL (CAAX protease family)